MSQIRIHAADVSPSRWTSWPRYPTDGAGWAACLLSAATRHAAAAVYADASPARSAFTATASASRTPAKSAYDSAKASTGSAVVGCSRHTRPLPATVHRRLSQPRRPLQGPVRADPRHLERWHVNFTGPTALLRASLGLPILQMHRSRRDAVARLLLSPHLGHAAVTRVPDSDVC